jgi:lambda family phage portal protein
LSALDKVIGYISPSAGLQRARARAALSLVERSYDGAKTGRRTSGWTTGGTSANSEIAPALTLLRNRSRDLVRNNPYAAKAINSLVSNAIGTGITPTLSDGQDLWKKWATECDADGQLDLYGLQMLAARTIRESGECLVRLRYRLPSDGLSVPLQLQVLEPDYLDNLKYENLPNGGWIQHGIEYDAIGRRAAYWLYKQHPGELAPNLNGLLSYRVPATDVLHIYEKTRPGQSRGVPVLAPSMLKMRDLDDYEEAELVRKGIEACFAAFVSTDNDNLTMGDASTETGSPSRRLENLSAGMIQYLKPGETVQFGAPTGVQGYNEYIRTQLHAIAAGCGITYEQLTGDLSQVNYSSIRAGTLEFRRMVEQWQWLTFIPMFCQPIMKAWLDSAVLAGKLKKADVEINWTTTRFDWVDPVRDVTGELMEIAAGLKPWSEAVRGRGYDPKSNIAEIAADQEAFAKAGIKIQLDTLLALGLGADKATQPDQTGNAAQNTQQAKKSEDEEYEHRSIKTLTDAISAMSMRQTNITIKPPNIDIRQGDTHVNLPESSIKVENTIQPAEVRAGDVHVTSAPAQIVMTHPTRAVQKVERDENQEILQTVLEYEFPDKE